MFRSRTRPVVYPQAEHQRLAGAIAAEWGNESVEAPPLPFESFVRGVAAHDRGYGELDDDGIGEMEDDRWLEIMRTGFAAQGEDPVVDLVAAMHIHRLVAGSGHDDLANAFAAELPALRAAADVTEDEAQAADRVTNICDRLAFAFCFEDDDAGTVAGFQYAVQRDGAATVAPWPLRQSEFRRQVVGYEAAGYPTRLAPVERTFVLRPG